jgi:hypothetical protein
MHNWVLLDTGAKFQPKRFFNYHFYGKASSVFIPNGYLHWLQIWDECCGMMQVDVFYPSQCNEGDKISVMVLFKTSKPKSKMIQWIHGKSGLFAEKYIRLFLTGQTSCLRRKSCTHNKN